MTELEILEAELVDLKQEVEKMKKLLKTLFEIVLKR